MIGAVETRGIESAVAAACIAGAMDRRGRGGPCALMSSPGTPPSDCLDRYPGLVVPAAECAFLPLSVHPNPHAELPVFKRST